MGVEAMEMVKKAMKVGLTIPVGPALRALFREASAVEIRALASRQALEQAERWGSALEPTHLSFAVDGAPVLAFGEEGPTFFSSDDVLLGSFVIQEPALEIVRHFLEAKEDEQITLHLGPSSMALLDHYLGEGTFPEGLEVSITAYDSGWYHDGYYTRLKVMDGGVSVEESWGGEDWDAWVVHLGDPGEEIEYIGTLDEYRRPPQWLVEALEEAKAKEA